MSSPEGIEKPKNLKTIFFIIVVCASSALILSFLASLLYKKQSEAKELDRSKQLLIAASILSHEGYFLVEENDSYIPAIFSEQEELLIPSKKIEKASQKDILSIYQNRVRPLLTDDLGNVFTFEEKNISLATYLEKNKKDGYANLPEKLLYAVLPNISSSSLSSQTDPIAYVIPIKGMGLWDAIYGYLAIEGNGDTVIGTTWYEQVETAGLGAEISSPTWQSQFRNKVIFHKGAGGDTNFERAPIGIVVVKGKVNEVFGSSAKADSAVDGITGATLTGMGVTNAYRNTLEKYRPFLLKIHNKQ